MKSRITVVIFCTCHIQIIQSAYIANDVYVALWCINCIFFWKWHIWFIFLPQHGTFINVPLWVCTCSLLVIGHTGELWPNGWMDWNTAWHGTWFTLGQGYVTLGNIVVSQNWGFCTIFWFFPVGRVNTRAILMSLCSFLSFCGAVNILKF